MTTRSKSTKITEEEKTISAKKVKTLDINQKVFLFDKQLIKKSENIKFEYLYHPGKGKPTLFIIDTESKSLFEILQFSEPNRSWLINHHVCSNGKLYFTVSLDPTFLGLHFLKKLCSARAMALHDIVDDDDPSVHNIMAKYIIPERLEVVADIKSAAGTKYFKYSPERAIAWLAIKVKNLVTRFKKESIYCGSTSLSQNYKKSVADQTVDEVDYLRCACDIVGSYVELDVHEKLKEYLGINEIEKAANNKRKSVNAEKGLAKKIKLEESYHENNKFIEESPKSALPIKEKKITAKEKALAKGAKGSKSISSFFKK